MTIKYQWILTDGKMYYLTHGLYDVGQVHDDYQGSDLTPVEPYLPSGASPNVESDKEGK